MLLAIVPQLVACTFYIFLWGFSSFFVEWWTKKLPDVVVWVFAYIAVYWEGGGGLGRGWARKPCINTLTEIGIKDIKIGIKDIGIKDKEYIWQVCSNCSKKVETLIFKLWLILCHKKEDNYCLALLHLTSPPVIILFLWLLSAFSQNML